VSPFSLLDLGTSHTASQAIRALLQSLTIDQGTIACALAVNERTVDRWLADDGYPQREARKRLGDLGAVKDNLYRTFKTEEGVRLWMHTDSRYLGGLKPVDALRAGRIDRVTAALIALDYGAFV